MVVIIIIERTAIYKWGTAIFDATQRFMSLDKNFRGGYNYKKEKRYIMKILKWVIDFIAIFTGLYLADVVKGFIPTESRLVEMVITFVLVVAMMYVAEFINGKLAKKKEKE